jgi:outer membrane protein OmpA-like peptidoglycan-associated protein
MSRTTGESGSATSMALGQLGPALGAGLISKGSTTAGASELLAMSERTGLPSTDPGDLARTLGDPQAAGSWLEKGHSMVSSLFGRKASEVSDSIASRTGIAGRSAALLLGLLAPVALSLLGRNARASDLGAEGLAAMLATQKGQLASWLPAGLGNLLGLGETAAAREHDQVIDDLAARPVHKPAPGTGRWWPLVVGAAATGLLLVVLPRLGRREDQTRPTPNPIVQGTAVQRRLPDGAQVQLTPGGAADRLLGRLQRGKGARADLATDIFVPGSSTALSSSGQQTLDEIARVLRGYPEAAVTVAGGGSSAGASAGQQEGDARALAKRRAQTVKRQLALDGIDPGRLAVSSRQAGGRSGASLDVRL